MLRAQGLPQHIAIIQDLESIADKHLDQETIQQIKAQPEQAQEAAFLQLRTGGSHIAADQKKEDNHIHEPDVRCDACINEAQLRGER